MTTTVVKYNAQYFLDFFKAIPEEKWIKGDWQCGDKACAMGHLGWHSSWNSEINHRDRGDKLIKIIKPVSSWSKSSYGHASIVTGINDNKDSKYQQDTPRLRMIAALLDARNLETDTTDED